MRFYIVVALIFLLGEPLQAALKVSVSAGYMTPTHPSGRDYMDDPAICIHPSDPKKSLIIGANKSRYGGLHVYDLKGRELSVAKGQAMNNVDIRYGFPLLDRKIDIVVASKPRSRSLGIFRLDFDSKQLVEITAPGIDLKVDPYGLSLYHDKVSGRFYAFVTTKRGYFHQYALLPRADGKVTVRLVRSVRVGSQCEGIVADDETGNLFVAEEDVGLWRYKASPDGGDSRISIAKVGGDLVDDLEGVALLKNSPTAGYLLLSSQGNDSYAVFDRQAPHKLKGLFKVIPKATMEGAEETDGLDVCNLNFGSDFPKGLLVVHDNRSSKGGGSNFKLVSWRDVAHKLNLKTAPDWNPRG